MLTQNIELWRVRLDTEQAQIEAMARRIKELKDRYALLVKEKFYNQAAELGARIDAIERNHVIMVQMREMLRDRLGQAGLLAAIEGR